MNRYYFSCSKFTVLIKTENDIIVKAAPIVQKFVGQPLLNLVKWVKKFDKDMIMEKLHDRIIR